MPVIRMAATPGSDRCQTIATSPMNIEPLASQQHLIPIIADQLHQEWREFAPWSDRAVIEARLRNASGQALFPHCLVASSATGEFLGTASVKLHELPTHPDKHHWLGEVFVPKPFRGRGIATAMIERIVDYAFSSGVQSLHLYTPDQQQFYERLGWQACGHETVNDEHVTIMVRHANQVPEVHSLGHR